MNRRHFLKTAAATASTLATLRAPNLALAQSSRPTLPTTSATTNPSPQNISPAEAATLARFGSRAIRLHDPSTPIKHNDQYWIFYTGRGVPSYHSPDLFHWERGPATFTQPPPWVAKTIPANRGGIDFWAPDIARIGDRYFLYYSASSFGKNTSAIGLGTNPTLDPADPAYLWTDQGIVIQSTAADNFNAIDPAITQAADGSWWLAFGSFWSGIKLIQIDPATGKRAAAPAPLNPDAKHAAPAEAKPDANADAKPDAPMHSLAHAESIEAPHIHHHAGHYYLIVNWGTCCRGVNSTYNLRIGRSKNITGPYTDKDGQDLLHSGGSLLLASTPPFIGPGQASIFQHNQIPHLSLHYYDATRRGLSMLAIIPLKWDENGWPVIDA